MKYYNFLALVFMISIFVSLFSFAYAVGDVADSQAIQDEIERKYESKFAYDNQDRGFFSTIGNWFSGLFGSSANYETKNKVDIENEMKNIEPNRRQFLDLAVQDNSGKTNREKSWWDAIKGWTLGKCSSPEGSEGDWMEIQCNPHVEQTYTLKCTGGSWVKQENYALCPVLFDDGSFDWESSAGNEEVKNGWIGEFSGEEITPGCTDVYIDENGEEVEYTVYEGKNDESGMFRCMFNGEEYYWVETPSEDYAYCYDGMYDEWIYAGNYDWTGNYFCDWSGEEEMYVWYYIGGPDYISNGEEDMYEEDYSPEGEYCEDDDWCSYGFVCIDYQCVGYA
jgi:hypothetical protein